MNLLFVWVKREKIPHPRLSGEISAALSPFMKALLSLSRILISGLHICHIVKLLLFFHSTKKKMELQGHRGFGKLAPFNSIRGFHLAGLTGLKSVEFDIRMLADKTIVVTHGPELHDQNSTIEQLNWDEAQTVPIGKSN